MLLASCLLALGGRDSVLVAVWMVFSIVLACLPAVFSLAQIILLAQATKTVCWFMSETCLKDRVVIFGRACAVTLVAGEVPHLVVVVFFVCFCVKPHNLHGLL